MNSFETDLTGGVVRLNWDTGFFIINPNYNSESQHKYEAYPELLEALKKITVELEQSSHKDLFSDIINEAKQVITRIEEKEMTNGKGNKRRLGNNTTYRENWEKIFEPKSKIDGKRNLANTLKSHIKAIVKKLTLR
ncbi:MAG: hypothetical protein GY718_03840 [Lentisphaerae bacterium]|nr:hypothetical protein [Lentisphaerota bacterium]